MAFKMITLKQFTLNTDDSSYENQIQMNNTNLQEWLFCQAQISVHCFAVVVFYNRTIDINSSEMSVNESLEGLGEILVALSYTMVLDSGLKLLSGDLSIL